jgi:hypothetical protein
MQRVASVAWMNESPACAGLLARCPSRAPDFAQQLAVRQHLAALAGQRQQQLIFAWRQIDIATVLEHAPRHLQIIVGAHSNHSGFSSATIRYTAARIKMS